MTGQPWPPPEDQIWLVHGTKGAVVRGVDLDGAERTSVAIAIEARLNLDPRDVEDQRTYVLDAPDLVELLAGLMLCGNQAFGSAFMMSSFGDVLGVSPRVRQETIDAVERAIDGLDV